MEVVSCSLMVIKISNRSGSIGFSRGATSRDWGDYDRATFANKALTICKRKGFVLWKVHQGALRGWEGAAGTKLEGPMVLGPGRGWGGRIRRSTLHSTTKAQRKALSNEGFSNKYTSWCKDSNKTKLNLKVSTSSGSEMCNWKCSLEMTSM